MKVLFICADNTNISCMAEIIFNQLCHIKSIKAFSAGIYVAPGTEISKNTVSIIKDKFNLDISKRKIIQLSEEMIEESNLVLTSTDSIQELLLEVFPEYKSKIFVLNEFVGIKDCIINPYNGDFKIYNSTFNLLKEIVLLLLDKLKEDNGI